MATNFGDSVSFNSDVTFGSGGSLTCPANSVNNAAITATAAIARSKLAQDTNVEFNIPFTHLRVWDDLSSLLPSAAAADDLGLVDGTFGTDAPKVQAGDLKAAGATTRYARFLRELPAEYDDAATVSVRIRAAMETTVADTSCTVDVECYLLNKDGGLNGSPTDLCTTAATSMNSLTDANYDFTLTESNLVTGSILDVRIAIACNDAATGTAVTPTINSIALLCDIKG